MNIFVGNLLFEANEGDVRKLFEGFGNVASVVIVMSKDKKAPRSRGFGFVQMPDEKQALAAIAALHEKEFMGRVLNVNPARSKTERQKVLAHPVLGKPGAYRGGRRTRSYIKRQEGRPPWKKVEGEPKAEGESKPWKKFGGKTRPWKKVEGEPKPWKKTGRENRAWSKPGEESKPWKKSVGVTKSWSKSNGRAQKSRFKGSKNLI